MKDYEALQKICVQEVIDAGIEPGEIVEWSINRRAMSRWGQCKRAGKDKYKINISYRLLEDDRVSEKACKTTIIHEILHTCKDGMKHTGAWKYYATVMNNKYGYNIKRVTSSAEKGLGDTKPTVEVQNRKNTNGGLNALKISNYKYIMICRNCGYQKGFKRTCKTVRYYRNYSCRVCGHRRAYDMYEYFMGRLL